MPAKIWGRKRIAGMARSYGGIAMLPDLPLGPLARVVFVGCAVRTMSFTLGAHGLGGPAAPYRGTV